MKDNKLMNAEELKRVIVSQKEDLADFFEKEKIVKRDVDYSLLTQYLSHPNVLMITGSRRSGKSVLSSMILEGKKYGYLSFDDERLNLFKVDDFERMLQIFYQIHGDDLEYFIFDEIHNVAGWELFITRLRKNKKIIITGSNAKLLSGELATHLTGRHIDFVLYPFSFREFARIKDFEISDNDLYSTKNIAKIHKLLDEYIEAGGFPDAIKINKNMVMQIYSDIITKDIIIRHKIKNIATFKELAQYALSCFSQEISYSKLKNIYNIKDPETVKAYIDYLNSSYLTILLERFSYKLKKQHIAPKKIYGIDSGLLNRIAFQFSSNRGRLIENVVLIELLRRKAGNDHKLELYYWKDHATREVDFVLKRDKKVEQLIQVCLDIDDHKTKEREIKSLVAASDELKCSNLLIITLDYEQEEQINDKHIKCVPLWKWLLQS